MSPERRRLAVLLGVLAIVASIAAYQYWPGTPSGAPAARGGRGPAGRGSSAISVEAPDVHLDALSAEKPKPDGDEQRNLFRFKERVAPPPAAPPPSDNASAPPPSNVPPGPPPLPPIQMRFIGLVESTEQARKIAILTDGRGLYQGREGDIIEGRYRILRIGVESVEMAYLDGRGRQTIRLSGS